MPTSPSCSMYKVVLKYLEKKHGEFYFYETHDGHLIYAAISCLNVALSTQFQTFRFFSFFQQSTITLFHEIWQDSMPLTT